MQKPVKYTIRDHSEETDCDYCGCPLYVGDKALEVENPDHHVYCSLGCLCRSSESKAA